MWDAFQAGDKNAAVHAVETLWQGLVVLLLVSHSVCTGDDLKRNMGPTDWSGI